MMRRAGRLVGVAVSLVLSAVILVGGLALGALYLLWWISPDSGPVLP